MIDDDDWNLDQERYYLLEIDTEQEQKEDDDEEQSIFTQIRKLDITYQERPA